MATLKAGQIQVQRRGVSCLSSSRGRFSLLPFLVPQLARMRCSGSKAGIVSPLSLSLFFWVPHPAPCHALTSGPDHSTSALTTLQKLDSSYCWLFQPWPLPCISVLLLTETLVLFLSLAVSFFSHWIFFCCWWVWSRKGVSKCELTETLDWSPAGPFSFQRSRHPSIPTPLPPRTHTHTHRITRPAGIS